MIQILLFIFAITLSGCFYNNDYSADHNQNSENFVMDNKFEGNSNTISEDLEDKINHDQINIKLYKLEQYDIPNKIRFYYPRDIVLYAINTPYPYKKEVISIENLSSYYTIENPQEKILTEEYKDEKKQYLLYSLKGNDYFEYIIWLLDTHETIKFSMPKYDDKVLYQITKEIITQSLEREENPLKKASSLNISKLPEVKPISELNWIEYKENGVSFKYPDNLVKVEANVNLPYPGGIGDHSERCNGYNKYAFYERRNKYNYMCTLWINFSKDKQLVVDFPFIRKGYYTPFDEEIFEAQVKDKILNSLVITDLSSYSSKNKSQSSENTLESNKNEAVSEKQNIKSDDEKLLEKFYKDSEFWKRIKPLTQSISYKLLKEEEIPIEVISKFLDKLKLPLLKEYPRFKGIEGFSGLSKEMCLELLDLYDREYLNWKKVDKNNCERLDLYTISIQEYKANKYVFYASYSDGHDRISIETTYDLNNDKLQILPQGSFETYYDDETYYFISTTDGLIFTLNQKNGEQKDYSKKIHNKSFKWWLEEKYNEIILKSFDDKISINLGEIPQEFQNGLTSGKLPPMDFYYLKYFETNQDNTKFALPIKSVKTDENFSNISLLHPDKAYGNKYIITILYGNLTNDGLNNALSYEVNAYSKETLSCSLKSKSFILLKGNQILTRSGDCLGDMATTIFDTKSNKFLLKRE